MIKIFSIFQRFFLRKKIILLFLFFEITNLVHSQKFQAVFW